MSEKAGGADQKKATVPVPTILVVVGFGVASALVVLNLLYLWPSLAGRILFTILLLLIPIWRPLHRRLDRDPGLSGACDAAKPTFVGILIGLTAIVAIETYLAICNHHFGVDLAFRQTGQNLPFEAPILSILILARRQGHWFSDWSPLLSFALILPTLFFSVRAYKKKAHISIQSGRWLTDGSTMICGVLLVLGCFSFWPIVAGNDRAFDYAVAALQVEPQFQSERLQFVESNKRIEKNAQELLSLLRGDSPDRHRLLIMLNSIYTSENILAESKKIDPNSPPQLVPAKWTDDPLSVSGSYLPSAGDASKLAGAGQRIRKDAELQRNDLKAYGRRQAVCSELESEIYKNIEEVHLSDQLFNPAVGKFVAKIVVSKLDDPDVLASLESLKNDEEQKAQSLPKPPAPNPTPNPLLKKPEPGPKPPAPNPGPNPPIDTNARLNCQSLADDLISYLNTDNGLKLLAVISQDPKKFAGRHKEIALYSNGNIVTPQDKAIRNYVDGQTLQNDGKIRATVLRKLATVPERNGIENADVVESFGKVLGTACLKGMTPSDFQDFLKYLSSDPGPDNLLQPR
jgi:hypothetical protein